MVLLKVNWTEPSKTKPAGRGRILLGEDTCQLELQKDTFKY